MPINRNELSEHMVLCKLSGKPMYLKGNSGTSIYMMDRTTKNGIIATRLVRKEPGFYLCSPEICFIPFNKLKKYNTHVMSSEMVFSNLVNYES